MHHSTTHPFEKNTGGTNVYVLTLDVDGVAELEMPPPSPTTTLIHHTLDEEALLVGCALTVYVGGNK
jgi:hypothetical protein